MHQTTSLPAKKRKKASNRQHYRQRLPCPACGFQRLIDTGQHALQDNVVEKLKSCLSDTSVLIVDGGDITKPCSPKMEYISRVRDGSTGEYGEGYHTISVTALTPEKKMPVCVYSNVYSASEPGFVNASGDAAEQIARMSLQGVEVATPITVRLC